MNTIKQVLRYQGSYLDWGTFSHRLFSQSPSKQKEKECKNRETEGKNYQYESIGSSIVFLYGVNVEATCQPHLIHAWNNDYKYYM